jgi:MFS superfamily sulfate permease-like transporter
MQQSKQRLWHRRKDEFVVALITTVTVFAVGVEQGIILAVVLSLLDLVRRHTSRATTSSSRTGPASRSTCRHDQVCRACPGW